MSPATAGKIRLSVADIRLTRSIGNTWAPEAIWNPTARNYLVFWASQLLAANDTAHNGTSYNRILSSTTKEFKTFSPAKTYSGLDPSAAPR